jgi:glutathione S-transferase
MYASEQEHKDAKAFNCVQRAHQNTLEFAPSMMVTLLIGGLQYPLVAAVLGALYGLARIQYFRGYASGDAKKRFSGGGVLIFPCHFGLIICTICVALHQFFPNLV